MLYRHNRITGMYRIFDLAGAFLAVITIFSLQSCTGAGEMNTIRVMSYNIAAGNGDIDRIADVIAAQEPDVVSLQEVDVHWSERSNFEDQARILGEALGMHYFFGEIYTLPPNDETMPSRQYGLAILSKQPFEQTENHSISRLSTVNEEAGPQPMPGFPEVTIEFHGQTIRLFNTHLDYRSDPAVRQTQAAETISIIEGFQEPVLLFGDLNARPDSPELAPLFSSLQDSWDEAEGQGYTYPSDNADRRIDYILHTEHFRVSNVFVVDVGASDHLPVVADLEFN